MEYQNYSASNPESTDLFNETPLVYGGFWERFGAAFLDGLILIIPNYVIMYAVSQEPGTIGIGNLLVMVLYWLYFALMESSSNQATIGKKALGLKVVDMNGGRISFGQATGRYFGKIISGIILCIGYLMMLWDDKKQTLHDKMAGTLVVKR